MIPLDKLLDYAALADMSYVDLSTTDIDNNDSVIAAAEA